MCVFFFLRFFFPFPISPTGKFFLKLSMVIFCFSSLDYKTFIVAWAVGVQINRCDNCGFLLENFFLQHIPWRVLAAHSCLMALRSGVCSGSGFALAATLKCDDHSGGGVGLSLPLPLSTRGWSVLIFNYSAALVPDPVISPPASMFFTESLSSLYPHILTHSLTRFTQNFV